MSASCDHQQQDEAAAYIVGATLKGVDSDDNPFTMEKILDILICRYKEVKDELQEGGSRGNVPMSYETTVRVDNIVQAHQSMCSHQCPQDVGAL